MWKAGPHQVNEALIAGSCLENIWNSSQQDISKHQADCNGDCADLLGFLSLQGGNWVLDQLWSKPQQGSVQEMFLLSSERVHHEETHAEHLLQQCVDWETGGVVLFLPVRGASELRAEGRVQQHSHAVLLLEASVCEGTRSCHPLQLHPEEHFQELGREEQVWLEPAQEGKHHQTISGQTVWVGVESSFCGFWTHSLRGDTGDDQLQCEQWIWSANEGQQLG